MADDKKERLQAVMEEVTGTIIKHGYTGFVGFVTEEGQAPCVIKMVYPGDKVSRAFVHMMYDYLMEIAKKTGVTFDYIDEQIFKPKL